MVEKVINLDDIELVGFLGVENKNIQEIETAFPKTKIISRGNKISIKGNKEQLLEVEKIIKSLMSHYHKFGKIDKKTVLSHINNGFSNEENESIVYGSSGKRIYAKTSNQKKIVDLHEKNDLLFVIGPAGTGKTYVSVALGVKALKEKKIKKIIITRPVVEAGENLGFLPGDLQDKIDPYLKPIYDALEDMIPVQKMKKFIENKTIEIAPLAYMRGRTLNNSFIIVDESQNTTKEQMKMVLTRMGFGSYLVINGDLTQIDLPKNIDSGLSNAVKVLKDTDGIGFTRFLSRDVVRHPLVRKIIDAYEYFEEKVKTK